MINLLFTLAINRGRKMLRIAKREPKHTLWYSNGIAFIKWKDEK